MFHGYRICPIFEVNRLLPHVDTGVPPLDLRQMNGMKKVDESQAKKSVEGFLTFLYHFVDSWHHSVLFPRYDGETWVRKMVFNALGAAFLEHRYRRNPWRNILMRMIRMSAAWCPLKAGGETNDK